jgi:hypothetical protein
VEQPDELLARARGDMIDLAGLGRAFEIEDRDGQD